VLIFEQKHGTSLVKLVLSRRNSGYYRASVRPCYIFRYSRRNQLELTSHGWGPKLAARFFNMNLNNTYKMYCLLYKEHHPKRKAMKLKPCINNLTQSLLQEGEEMKQRGVGAPPSASKNLDSSFSPMKAEAFDLIQLDQPFPHPQPMVLEQYMVVLLVHHLLLFVLELSTNNN
jgi:hypothetical protein